MNRRQFIISAGLCGAAALSFGAAPAKKPNLIFILIDDMGWRDVGFNGSKFYETPNLDNLAKKSMRFTNAYAACAVCSPTRASIMTGKYPARLHITDWIGGEGEFKGGTLLLPKWQKQLPLEETTIAEALKPAGYVCASIGKWHLGGKDFYPEKQGFEVNVGGGHIGHPASYFYPYGKDGSSNQVPGLQKDGESGEYLTDRLGEEAAKFIGSNKDKPFFLYLPHYAVHGPLESKPELTAKYKNKKALDEQDYPVYAGMVKSVDESVGLIVKTLEENGLMDNTMIVFTSDNGGVTHFRATSNKPLRSGKGFPYEGGIREPTIIYWPGVTSGDDCDTPVSSIDYFPTLLEAAGISDNPDKVDGLSLVPLLKKSGGLSRDALYWHYPHYWFSRRVRPYSIVRAGDWKLIEFHETGRLELYNLKDDMSETKDLAGDKPEKAAELKKKLHDWLKAVGAQMPIDKKTGKPLEL